MITAETRLWAAVLLQALRDSDGRDDHAAAARRWLQSTARDVGSRRWIMDLLGCSPQYSDRLIGRLLRQHTDPHPPTAGARPTRR